MTETRDHRAINEIFSVYVRIGEQPSSDVTEALAKLIGETPNRILQMFFKAVAHPGDRLNAGTG